MKKLHLGCWKRDWPGFVNVDLADFPHIHYRRGVDDLSVLEDGSFDVVYASHVLEYFAPADVPRVLAEWRRVLRPLGLLYIAVPDFQGLARAYERYGDVRQVQGPLLGCMDIPDGNGGSVALHHRAVYDLSALRAALEENGFSNVQKYSWQEIVPTGQEDHSMAHIPSRDYANGISVSLNVKAEKASGPVRLALAAQHHIQNMGRRIIRKGKKILA